MKSLAKSWLNKLACFFPLIQLSFLKRVSICMFHCSLMFLKKNFFIDIDFNALCMYHLHLCLIDFILSLQVFKSRSSCLCQQVVSSALNNILCQYAAYLQTTIEIQCCLLGNNTCENDTFEHCWLVAKHQVIADWY